MQNYKILSLGYNCCIKRFVDVLSKKDETNFFDYIGSSMWAINELFQNDFQDMFNITDYENMEVLPGHNVITHKKYYLRFLHDLKTLNNFKKIKESYERRVIRFNNFLKDRNKLLFIRLEEPKQTRIIYEEYKDKFQKSELEYLKDFTNIIKTKNPKLDFKIIFITETFETEYLKDFNILILKKDNSSTNWDTCISLFKKLFEENKDLIHQLITL
jgi:hypothetical protein